METIRPGRRVDTEVFVLERETRKSKHDDVVAEEPLELRVACRGETRTLAVTMRTPGNDFELAAGFVYAEAIAGKLDDIASITYCLDAALDSEQRYNVVNVALNEAAGFADAARFERHFTMNSSCGVCGRAQLQSLQDRGIAPVKDAFRIPPARLYELPHRMRESQRVFDSTGGLHAAALFDDRGDTMVVREDVGRHNAVDKVLGWGLLNGRLPFARTVLVVSGRTSYEILQKSAVARIPIVCSVSAPTSLAVDLARAFNITLVGFLRGERANVYAAAERIEERT